MALIFLDRQHTGKNNRRKSLGAVGDFDGDGKKDIHEAEAIWTARYLLSCEIRLRELGYDVMPISDGYYYQRHQRCNEYQKAGEKAIYIAAHLNAGVGGGIGYGSMFYDYRSTSGKQLADCINKHLDANCPELQGKTKSIAASRDNWTRNAYATIKGVKAIGICAEPCFVDSSAHKSLFTLDGMERIGQGIANGIHEFFQGS